MLVNARKEAKVLEDIIRMSIDLYRGLECKYCGSGRVVKYGQFRGIQRYWCKDCHRKFADNDAAPKMKTPARQVASALSMYYGGMSLNGIRRHLQQQYGYCPAESTVYGWVANFTKKAVESAKNQKPNVGNVWIADETILKIGGKNVWFWDVIDVKTRFLLASHLSPARTTRDAQILMEEASQRAGKIPKVVITDQLRAYLDGVELTFGAETRHIPAKGLRVQPNTNLVERFHGTLKDRTKVMRGLKQLGTAKLLLDGWLVHYNFFRPHESLAGKTPAEEAGIDFKFKDWGDVVRGKPEPIRLRFVNSRFIVEHPYRASAVSRREKTKAKKPRRKRHTAPGLSQVH